MAKFKTAQFSVKRQMLLAMSPELHADLTDEAKRQNKSKTLLINELLKAALTFQEIRKFSGMTANDAA